MDTVKVIRRVASEREYRAAGAPVPDRLFSSPARGWALRELWFALSNGEACEMTGEPGLGKTLLCKELLLRLPKAVRTVCATAAQHGRGDVVAGVERSLGVARGSEDRANSRAGMGYRWAIVVDDAHRLDHAGLARLAALRDRETAAGGTVGLLLVGRPSLRQSSSRIATRCLLRPFSKSETAQYVRYWLSLHSPTSIAYSDSATHVIHCATGGSSRRINGVCARALQEMRSRGKRSFNALVAARVAWKMPSVRWHDEFEAHSPRELLLPQVEDHEML